MTRKTSPSSMARRFTMAFLLMGGFAYPSFEFVLIPTSTRDLSLGLSSVAERGDLTGLWNNPASVADNDHLTSMVFSLHSQFDMTLLAGGVARQFGAWTIGAGILGLSYGEIVGDVEYFGDAGRKLATSSLLFTGTLAISMDRAVNIPFGWDIGLSLSQAHESLDGKTRGLAMADMGMVFAYRLHKTLSLRGGIGANHLPIEFQARTMMDSPVRYTFGVSGQWKPHSILSVTLQFQEEWATGDAWRTSGGLEALLGGIFSIRAGLTTGSERSFQLGIGFHLALSDSGKIQVDVAGMPGQSRAETMGTLRAGFGPKSPAEFQ